MLCTIFKAIFFLSIVYCSLIIKLVDESSLISHNMNHNQVVSTLESFEEIIKASLRKNNEKFVLLNAILDDDLQNDNYLVPDWIVSDRLILKDLKNILAHEAGDDQNMYSVHVDNESKLEEVSKKIDQLMVDERIACYVFLTSKNAWDSIEIEAETSNVHQERKQRVLLSSSSHSSQEDPEDRKTVALASSSDFCPATLSDCVSSTANCSNHGSCILQNHPRQIKKQCYFCSCTVKKWTDDYGKTSKLYGGKVDWTGPACQYQDIAVPFHIIFWTSLALLVVILFSIGILYDIGEGGAGFGVAGSGIALRLKQE